MRSKLFFNLTLQIALVSSFLLLSSSPSFSSQCIKKDIWQIVEESEYIFSATIIGLKLHNVERRPADDSKSQGYPQLIEIEFDPIVEVKGSSDELEYLYSKTNSATNFRVGGTYNFFTNSKGGVGGACGGEHYVEQLDAQEKVMFLEEIGLIKITR